MQLTASGLRNVGLSGDLGVAALMRPVLKGASQMKVTKKHGMLLLGIWLIVTGLVPLLNLSFSGLGTLMAIVAIAAGALILVGR
jgi:hypothetical protein